jgi:hypothetical protein
MTLHRISSGFPYTLQEDYFFQFCLTVCDNHPECLLECERKVLTTQLHVAYPFANTVTLFYYFLFFILLCDLSKIKNSTSGLNTNNELCMNENIVQSFAKLLSNKSVPQRKKEVIKVKYQKKLCSNSRDAATEITEQKIMMFLAEL